MANGDAAALAGFTPVPGSKDIKTGYDDINRLADWVAGKVANVLKGTRGSVSMTTSGSSSPYEGSADVTFPAGLFSSRPKIFLAIATSAPVDSQVGFYNASATGMSIYYRRENSSANTDPVTIDWVAIA